MATTWRQRLAVRGRVLLASPALFFDGARRGRIEALAERMERMSARSS